MPWGLSTGRQPAPRGACRINNVISCPPSGSSEKRPGMASDPVSKPAHPRERPLAPEETLELLDRFKGGDDAALEQLLERCMPPLRRWAHGRLPSAARGMLESADLVQDTVLAAMRRLDAFEWRHQGSLQAYLRNALMNRIRDVMRQCQRR